MELVWLAPDIQQEILEFRPTGATRFPISEVAARRVAADLAWAQLLGAGRPVATPYSGIESSKPFALKPASHGFLIKS